LLTACRHRLPTIGEDRSTARLGGQRVSYIIPTTQGQVEISYELRSRHMYVAGRTGAGKSTLIQELTLQDIEAGNGVCLIDFHGDLVRAVADTVPEERIGDTILFSPLDPTHVCTIDMFDHTDPLERTAIVSRIISIFKSLWWDAWGPSTNYITYNDIRLLLESPDTTLCDIPRVLTDSQFRNTLLKKLDDDDPVKIFWTKEFASWPDRFRAERIAPIQNKATVFTNPILAPILGAKKATLNIREIIDTKKVLLCDFSKAKMGDDNAHILASLLVNLFYQAALSRQDTPPEQRHLYNLIIDEFQNVPIETIETIFSEARKYQLGLTVAHQHTKQVPDKILSAALANAATKIIFKVNGFDAELLSPDIGLDKGVIAAIPQYHARISLDAGQPHLHALKPIPRRGGKYARVKQQTRDRYSLAR
jgi:hypothetical protein